MECSQQANAEVMREMTRKLYSQYEEKLQEEQQRHNAEKEALLVCMSHLLMEQPGSVGCIIVENEVTQSCPTLCDLIDCSLPGSSLHGTQTKKTHLQRKAPRVQRTTLCDSAMNACVITLVERSLQ